MSSLLDAVVESWDREADIVNRLAAAITPEDLEAKAAPGEGNIAYHLCHIHLVRMFWLKKVSETYVEGLDWLFEDFQEWRPSMDLDKIRGELKKSGAAISRAVRDRLEAGEPVGVNYTHPIHFMQHMLWHDGWHVGVIVLALRQAGREPSDAWQEENMWGIWRYEEPWEG